MHQPNIIEDLPPPLLVCPPTPFLVCKPCTGVSSFVVLCCEALPSLLFVVSIKSVIGLLYSGVSGGALCEGRDVTDLISSELLLLLLPDAICRRDIDAVVALRYSGVSGGLREERVETDLISSKLLLLPDVTCRRDIDVAGDVSSRFVEDCSSDLAVVAVSMIVVLIGVGLDDEDMFI